MKVSVILAILAGVVVTIAAPLAERNGQDIVPLPSIYDKAFQDAVINEHNKLRKGHCAQPLRWDNDLARLAQADVNTCAEHVEHMRAGSNLMGFDPAPVNWIETGFNCSWQWYSEEKKYDYQHPGFSDATGHFTQLVWRDSQRLGCAFAHCPGVNSVHSRFFCYYDPIGNYINPGMFEQNVWRKHSCAWEETPEIPAEP
ncbi:PR-1-like protein [Delitschia confertaspora ATCC 74209]|uniref:PR-1-like protein n=1 Tax=Delitschia confertaspora ATCC 74209 TaxID=1513339 RepID=A0A9P4MZ79_9PLEO|nr:PR-1-like protein [Delitschia confertaspora ATCC 74209]